MWVTFDLLPASAVTGLFIFTTAPFMRITTSFRGKLKLTKCIQPVYLQEYDIVEEWKATHNLSYPPIADTDRFYVGICIVSIHSISGRSGAYLCASDYFENESGGIGDMIVEDDFIVS